MSSRKTVLYDFHVNMGARMVRFAGYLMPLNYQDGIISEHGRARNQAALFDISHMGQVSIRGESAAAALEQLVPSNIQDLSLNRQRYTVFTSDAGGILDDLIVTNAGDYLLLVVNAARKEFDLAHLKHHLGNRFKITLNDDFALLALQGPKAAAILETLSPGIGAIPFMSSQKIVIDGIDVRAHRCGYTGEDGFELSVSAEHTERLAHTLVANDDVYLAGLGARDSLRLEAGLCLYGHDIDANTTPIEAGLNWLIRKTGSQSNGFPGEAIVREQMHNGPTRKLVGIKPQSRSLVREGAELLCPEAKPIGRVTSGGYSPVLAGPIAMGYVSRDYSREAAEIQVVSRGRPVTAKIVSLPFVEHRYFTGKP